MTRKISAKQLAELVAQGDAISIRGRWYVAVELTAETEGEGAAPKAPPAEAFEAPSIPRRKG